MYYITKIFNINSFEGIILIRLISCATSFFAPLSVFFIAALPFIEAKGAIPIGMSFGLSPIDSFFCSYLGSMLPVPFLLILITPFLEYINSNKKFAKLSQKINNYISKKMRKIKTQNKEEKLDKPVRFFTLFIFVALPFPATGVWSGSIVAKALKIKTSHAFFAIALGNFFASVLVFLATFGFFV
jgi:uncharacterized membrane protein